MIIPNSEAVIHALRQVSTVSGIQLYQVSSCISYPAVSGIQLYQLTSCISYPAAIGSIMGEGYHQHHPKMAAVG